MARVLQYLEDKPIVASMIKLHDLQLYGVSFSAFNGILEFLELHKPNLLWRADFKRGIHTVELTSQYSMYLGLRKMTVETSALSTVAFLLMQPLDGVPLTNFWDWSHGLTGLIKIEHETDSWLLTSQATIKSSKVN